MHCSVIFMHMILYNMLFKRDCHFWDTVTKNVWGNYFASIYSLCQKSKDYKCFAKMVSRLLKCFITVTFKIVTLNKEGKQHCHQMHDKPKYENGKCLINLVIGWVKYMGEFYMWFLFCSD